MAKPKPISEALSVNLRASVRYEPDTGRFFWLVDRPRQPPTKDKETALSKKARYRHIKFEGEVLLAHRVAWFLYYGQWPKDNFTVDHRNGDTHDNRISNLRLASFSENGANRKPNHSSRTGIKGVSFCSKTQKYKVKIKSNGVSRHLGYFDNISDAHRAYKREASVIFGEYARA